MPIDPPMLRDRLSRAAAVVPHARGQRFERQRLQRNEDQPEAEPLDDAADDHRLRRLVDRKAGHHVERRSHQEDADSDQHARVELPDQPPGEQHRNQRADAARSGEETRLQHRIAVERLEQRRQQREAGEQQHAGHRHEEQSGREIAVGEHRRSNKGAWRSPCARRTSSGADRDAKLDDRFPACEPVVLLAAVEEQLQRAERDREQREAEQSNLRSWVSVLGMKRSISKAQMTPTGRLTRNTQRQL
jgi:hypothetical protein